MLDCISSPYDGSLSMSPHHAVREFSSVTDELRRWTQTNLLTEEPIQTTEIEYNSLSVFRIVRWGLRVACCGLWVACWSFLPETLACQIFSRSFSDLFRVRRPDLFELFSDLFGNMHQIFSDLFSDLFGARARSFQIFLSIRVRSFQIFFRSFWGRGPDLFTSFSDLFVVQVRRSGCFNVTFRNPGRRPPITQEAATYYPKSGHLLPGFSNSFSLC